MGHHLGSKSSIIPLIDRLNKYPIGLVDSDKLREILELLFDEREAYVASRFPLEEATLDELSRLTKDSGGGVAAAAGEDGRQGAGDGHALRRRGLLPAAAGADRFFRDDLHEEPQPTCRWSDWRC